MTCFGNKMGINILAAVLVAFFLAGCAGRPCSDAEIADVLVILQNPLAFVGAEAAEQALIAPDIQKNLAEDFYRRYFAPWHDGKLSRPFEKAFWILEMIASRKVYGENLRPYSDEELQELIDNARPDTYPSLSQLAIAVRNSSFRALPTAKPAFLDPALAGEGFPFDYVQNSSININAPVRVSHISEDGRWVFAENELAYGWLPAEDVAWVDASFVSDFKTGHYLALTCDDVDLMDSGIFRGVGNTGSIFPLIRESKQGYEVLLAYGDKDRRAVLHHVVVGREDGTIFPLAATPRNFAVVASRMIGQKYGWGGLFGNRDCSATMRDIFSPFGIWLPRNASRQAESGQVIQVAGLPMEEKERLLLEKGIPFLTLVCMPRHVMLYVGQEKGRALVLHNLWGLKTRTFWGGEGRKIVGKTVLTTLKPGKELKDLARPDGLLLYRTEKIVLLGGDLSASQ